MQLVIEAGQLLSAAPLPLAEQVPMPFRLHAVHVPHDEVMQQTLSTQKPLLHCVPVVHAVPFASGAAHVPPLQISPLPQVVPPQQSCPAPPQRQTPPVSHARLVPHLLVPAQQG
jgi:hypothetical protein